MKHRIQKPSSSETEVVGSKSFESMWQEVHEKEYAIEQPPANAITSLAYAKLNKVSRPVAVSMLDKLVRHEKLEMGMFSIFVDGRRRHCKHYWPKK